MSRIKKYTLKQLFITLHLLFLFMITKPVRSQNSTDSLELMAAKLISKDYSPIAGLRAGIQQDFDHGSSWKLSMNPDQSRSFPKAVKVGVWYTFDVANCSSSPIASVNKVSEFENSQGFSCAPCLSTLTPYIVLKFKIFRSTSNLTYGTYLGCKNGMYTLGFQVSRSGRWIAYISLGNLRLPKLPFFAEPGPEASGEKPRDERLFAAYSDQHQQPSDLIQNRKPDLQESQHFERLQISGAAGDVPSAASELLQADSIVLTGDLQEERILGSVESPIYIAVEARGWGARPCSRAVEVRALRSNKLAAPIATVTSCDLIRREPRSNLSSAADEVPLRQCTLADEEGRCEVYNLTLRLREYGPYAALVSVNGSAAHGSPFTFWVAPPDSYPWFNSSRLVSPRDDWQYMDQLEFGVVARNFHAQRTNSCEPVVEGVLQYRGWRADSPPPDVAAQVECQRGPAGAAYRLWIGSEVEDGSWLLSVRMDGHPVASSPLPVTVRPGVSAKLSVLSGPGLRRAVAGEPAAPESFTG